MRLKAQQKKNTITSILIALLTIVLVGLLLFLVLLPSINNYEAEIVSYPVPTEDVETSDKPTPVRSLETKPVPPSAASSSMAKVIASNITSSVSVAVPEEISLEESLDFAENISFDDAWGNGDAMAGTTSFFGQDVSAERILYVIDYSKSMNGKREELMRKELADSVKKLSSSMKYQLVFFAGQSWVAGDEITMMGGARSTSSVIKSKANGKEYTYRKGNPDKVQKPIWLTADENNLNESTKYIEETQLYYGTQWSNPLDMAFEMKPLPDTIIFMTDGMGGTQKEAENYAKQAKKKGVIVHTISLLEPKAAQAMSALGENTGGTFSLINDKGRKEDYKGK